MSSASILVRFAFAAAGTNSFALSLLLGAGRMLLASVFLAPAWFALWRPASPPHRAFGLAALSGLLLAAHFGTWFTSLSLTSVAASLVLVTLGPVWTALIGTWFGIERIGVRAWFGIAVALAGALIIGLADAGGSVQSAGPNPLLGDALALAGGIFVAGYRLLGRAAQHRGLPIGGFSAVAYGVGGLALLPLPLFFSANSVPDIYLHWPWPVYGWLVALALIPQLIGHTSANWAIRWFSPTLVSLLILFEPVGASTVAWLLFGEAPTLAVWIGGAVTLVGVSLAAGNK